MSNSSKHSSMNTENLLVAFANRGFDRTPMEDVATTAGVSRQSIYKRFGSKEDCYRWAIDNRLELLDRDINQILGNVDLKPSEALYQSFELLISGALALLKRPQGRSVLVDFLRTAQQPGKDWLQQLQNCVAEFLHQHDLIAADRSEDTAYTMVSACKGMLFEESLENHYERNLQRVVHSVVD